LQYAKPAIRDIADVAVLISFGSCDWVRPGILNSVSFGVTLIFFCCS